MKRSSILPTNLSRAVLASAEGHGPSASGVCGAGAEPGMSCSFGWVCFDVVVRIGEVGGLLVLMQGVPRKREAREL